MISVLLLAVTLNFTNTDPNAIGFGILHSPAADPGKPLLYYRANPNPGTVGAVTILLPPAMAQGDCYQVVTIGRAMSAPSNAFCFDAPGPKAAEGLSVQP